MRTILECYKLVYKEKECYKAANMMLEAYISYFPFRCFSNTTTLPSSSITKLCTARIDEDWRVVKIFKWIIVLIYILKRCLYRDLRHNKCIFCCLMLRGNVVAGKCEHCCIYLQNQGNGEVYGLIVVLRFKYSVNDQEIYQKMLWALF